MINHSFKKEERLTHKKTFDILFVKGRSLVVPPLKLIWLTTEAKLPFPAQTGISVPKKSFPKAVDRNTLKRRIRESYRKNKHLLYEILKKKNLSIALMILYTARKESSYVEIEKKMIVSLQKLIEQVE